MDLYGYSRNTSKNLPGKYFLKGLARETVEPFGTSAAIGFNFVFCDPLVQEAKAHTLEKNAPGPEKMNPLDAVEEDYYNPQSVAPGGLRVLVSTGVRERLEDLFFIFCYRCNMTE